MKQLKELFGQIKDRLLSFIEAKREARREKKRRPPKVPAFNPEEDKCRNCGTAFDTPYCPQCGQTADVKRLTFRTWMHNIFDTFFSIDNTTFRTFWMMFTRPGLMIKEYISGRRKDYRNPFTLLIIFCTFYGLMAFSINLIQGKQEARNEFIRNENKTLSNKKKPGKRIPASDTIYVVTTPAAPEIGDNRKTATHSRKYSGENKRKNVYKTWNKFKHPEMQAQHILQIFRELTNNMYDSLIFRCILMIPFYALFTKLLFFRRSRGVYNYTELVFATAFTTCQKVIIDLMLYPIGEFTSHSTTAYMVFFYIFFPAWTYKGLFGIKWRTAIWKSILIYLLTFIFSFFFMIFVMVLIVILLILIFDADVSSLIEPIVNGLVNW